MRHTNPGQDQKAHIVGQEMEVTFSRFGIPANERIARRNFPRRGAKQQAGERIVMTVKDHVLDVLADRTGVTEIMVERQKSFEEFLFAPILDWRNVDRPKGVEFGDDGGFLVKNGLDGAMTKSVVGGFERRRQEDMP